jgi:hypothetical protein
VTCYDACVRALLIIVSAGALLGAIAACDSLKVAPAPATTPEESDASSDAGQPADDAGDGSVADAQAYSTYVDRQRFLSLLRFPGPTTAKGSTGVCTSRFFVWRDADGTMHSWEASTHVRADHTFRSARSVLFPSDSFIAVDVLPAYAQVDVYPVGTPSLLLDTIPSPSSYAATNDGVIRADQSIGGVDIGGTKIRRWLYATKQTEDISQVLPTTQRLIAFANDQVVLPGGVDVPFALHVVSVKSKTAASVMFDNAASLNKAVPSPSGLLVDYARPGTVPALRLYRNDKDDAASLLELGDKLATLPGLFPDSPSGEHDFIGRVATYGHDVVVYGGAFGVFAFDLAKSALVPLQLDKDRQGFLPDIMCVMADAGLLVYRIFDDPTGQVWTVSIPGLLP